MKNQCIKQILGVSLVVISLCVNAVQSADQQDKIDVNRDSAKVILTLTQQQGEYMDTKVIEECSRLSLKGTIIFPEVVKRLAEVGVTSYQVDLVGFEKIVYGKDREALKYPFKPDEVSPIAEEFNGEEVKRAILDIQQQKITYQPFLHRIMAAGISHYEVYIKGRKAIYIGRNGDLHIENFPDAK